MKEEREREREQGVNSQENYFISPATTLSHSRSVCFFLSLAISSHCSTPFVLISGENKSNFRAEPVPQVGMRESKMEGERKEERKGEETTEAKTRAKREGKVFRVYIVVGKWAKLCSPKVLTLWTL